MKKQLIILVMAAGVSLSADSALKHHYRFDEAKMLDSAGSCHGTVSRLCQTEGLYGKALYFARPADPKARNVFCTVSLPVPPAFFAKPFTVTLWYKPDAKNSYRDFKDLLSLGGELGPGIRLTYFYNSLFFRSGDGKKVFSMGTNSSQTVLPVNRWNQIAVVYDGETGRLYLNGVLKAEKKLKLLPGKGNLTVGTFGNGYAYPAQGALDELKIYGKALSAVEISDAFAAEMK